MRKISLFLAALAVTLCAVYTSCKKTTHGTNPALANSRLTGFTRTTAGTITLPLTKYVPTVVESYSFSYDNSGRLSQIIYSSNDPATYDSGKANLIITFNYSAATIIRLTTTTNTADTVEIDSFVENSSGLVTNAYTPLLNNIFQYTGNLMFKNTAIGHDSLGTMTTVSTITSSGGNFLQLTYNGSLTETFTGLMGPIKLYYTYFNTTGLGIVPTVDSTTATNSNVTLNGYSRVPVSVMAVDTLHDTAYGEYPGSIWLTENYTFYGIPNTTGDYFQLMSFIKYGTNIYQNTDLVKSITNSGFTKTITYTIDEQSMVDQTSVAITDSLGNSYTEVYNLQYGTK